jgi:hypothetical protein
MTRHASAGNCSGYARTRASAPAGQRKKKTGRSAVFSLEHLGLTAEIDEFFLLPSARGNEAARDFYRRQG